MARYQSEAEASRKMKIDRKHLCIKVSVDCLNLWFNENKSRQSSERLCTRARNNVKKLPRSLVPRTLSLRDIHHQNLIRKNVDVVVGARQTRFKALRLLINRRYWQHSRAFLAAGNWDWVTRMCEIFRAIRRSSSECLLEDWFGSR